MKTKVISKDMKDRCKRLDRLGVEEVLGVLHHNSLVNLSNSKEEDFKYFQGQLHSLEKIQSLIN